MNSIFEYWEIRSWDGPPGSNYKRSTDPNKEKLVLAYDGGSWTDLLTEVVDFMEQRYGYPFSQDRMQVWLNNRFGG